MVNCGMRFQYIASETDGKVIEGNIEAKNPAEVLQWMVEKGLRPVSIRPIGRTKATGWKRSISLRRETISIEDRVFLTKYLALMLRVGTDLFRAIDILIADFDKPALKYFLMEVKDSLSRGEPLHTTFAKYPKYFSSVFVSLVKAGEKSGNLERVFETLSINLEKERELRGKVKSALTYPLVLVGLSLVIMFLMLTITLPKIAKTFLSGGFEVPAFSKAVFSVGLLLGKYFIFIIPAIFIIILGFWLFLKKSTTGQRFFERLIRRMPVIRDIVFKLAFQRFASTLASLLRSGTPIIEALETTADAAGSPELRAAVFRISREGIAKGLTVGEAFRRETYFPRVVVNLIAISEKSGHLEEVLDTLAGFYASESDNALKTLVAFLEPVLLVIIGFVVAIIALAIIVPIYQLIGKV